MKKLLFLLTVIACMSYAQNTDKNTSYIGANDVLYRSFQKTREALRFLDVMGDSFTTKIDSFSTGDTVKTFYFNGKYQYGFITLYDSVGVTDTFYVERYDTLSPYAAKLWTVSQVGLVDITTGQYTPTVTGRYAYSGTGIVIPGSGLIKMYYINEPRPRTWRVWIPASVAAGKKKYIKFTGKN